MKFKINRLGVELLLSKFEKTNCDYEELELEPVWETFKEAEKFEQQIKNKAYEQGYNNGYVQGLYKNKNHKINCPIPDLGERNNMGNKAVKCPVCSGTGLLPNGFYSSLGHYPITTNSTEPETCKSCGGKGFIIIN